MFPHVMASQKTKVTFVLLIMVYLCAWGLKQHILQDKGTKGAHPRDAPRILRRADNTIHQVRAPQPPTAPPPIEKNPAPNDRLNGSRARREAEAVARGFGPASDSAGGNRKLAEFKRYVRRSKRAWSELVSPSKMGRRVGPDEVQNIVLKMPGKKETVPLLRRRRSKYTSGKGAYNATRPGASIHTTGNEKVFPYLRAWRGKGAVECLTPTLLRHLRSGGKAGRAEAAKLLAAMWSACGAEFEGQKASPFIHILGRSSRALRRASAFLVWMYQQERGQDLGPHIYLGRIHQLNAMLNILNKMRSSLIRWSESLRQNLVQCLQCLPVWLHYMDQSFAEPLVADFLLNTKPSRHPASSPFSSNKQPQFKTQVEPKKHQRTSPSVAALLVKMTDLLIEQDRGITGLNSSLHGMQGSLSITRAQGESRFRSPKQYFITLILSLRLTSYIDTNSWVQQNVSYIFLKQKSFCQNLINNLNSAMQTTKQWLHMVYEHLVRSLKFLFEQLLSLHDLGFRGINKWLTSQYNHMLFQLIRVIINNKEINKDDSGDYDATSGVTQERYGHLKSNESTEIQIPRSVDSNESQNVINSVKSRMDTVTLNATARDILLNKAIGVDVANTTKTVSSIAPRSTNSIFNQSALRQNGSLNESNSSSRFSGGESELGKVKISHYRAEIKDVIKLWIRLLIVLKYVGEPSSNKNGIFTETETKKVNSSRSVGAKNIPTPEFPRRQMEVVKSMLKEDASTKSFTFLRKHVISNTTKARRIFNTSSIYKLQKHHKRTDNLHGLARLWKLRTRQLSRFLTWLVLLPQRTLSFIRRIEMANLKLRMMVFRRLFQVHSRSRQHGPVDEKTERLGKAKQKEAFRNQKMVKFDEKEGETQAKSKVLWNLSIYKIENTKVNKKTIEANDGAQLNNTSLKNVIPQPPRSTQNDEIEVKTVDRLDSSSRAIHIDKQRKWFKRPSYLRLDRKRRSPHANGEDEDLKKQMKKLHRIANNHRKDRIDDLVTSEKLMEESHRRKPTIPIKKANRPKSHHYSQEDADVLRLKLLNLINLVELHKNGTDFPGTGAVMKETYSSGINLEDIDDSVQNSDDSIEDSENNVDETEEDLFSIARNGEPTEADFELLNNIELLTKKFLGKKNKKIRSAYLRPLIDFEDHGDIKHRRKRSDDGDERTAGELGERPESEQLKDTGPDDKVKESRQFIQKWTTLRKQAQNLQTEVNSARDKYASASDELALLLKKGNTLHDKVASASSAQGVHKSMLEENWKNVNKEFEKYKSDIAARESEILSEDKRVNAEKIDQTLLKLEDAVSDQGDPNDRILGDTAVLPFNAKLDRLGPALRSMKNEATLAGQIASGEVMLESEDAEDDVFKANEAGDYSIVDFDYSPDAKFVDEEDSDIAEDAESLTGFDYEIDRHSDSQLEDVDNMLSKLIARRFRSKRRSGDLALQKVEKTPEAHRAKNVSHHTKRKKTLSKTREKTIKTLAGASARWHSVKRWASPAEVRQALNSGDGESGDYEEQTDISDEINDIEGGRIVDETNEVTADNNLDLISRFNLSNSKLRVKANELIDVAANKELMPVGEKKSVRRNNKKVGTFNINSDLLGFDSGELGVDAKQLNELIVNQNGAIATIPLGSDADIENGAAEIRREKEFLTAADERIDEDIPSDDELKPYDQVINESMEDFSDADLGDAKGDTWRQKANLETAQLKLLDAEEEKQRMELSDSSETQRQRERFQHRSDLVELETVNKGLDKALVDLDQATKEVHSPPLRPAGDEKVMSLYADEEQHTEEEDVRNGAAQGASGTLLRKRRSIYKKRRKNIAKPDFSKAAALKSHPIARNDTKINGFEESANPGVEHKIGTSSRIEREANPSIDDDLRAAATAEGSIDGDLDEEVEDESTDTGVYYDDVLYEDEDSLAEEWEMAKPNPKRNTPKKIANSMEEGIQGQLLDAKSVVRQLKEEEEVAGHLLPPSSLVRSEQDLMEFGRNPDAKDMFLNVLNPVGLAELSDDEVRELNGPVLSSTDIEKALDNPTELVSALEGIENEIKSTKHSVLSQTLDISQIDGSGYGGLNSAGESADEVSRQIEIADEMGNSLLGRKAFAEGFDALDDARRARLTQKLLDEQEERDSQLMDGGNTLGEALQDLDQYKVDKETEQMRAFLTFKDVLQEKREKTLK